MNRFNVPASPADDRLSELLAECNHILQVDQQDYSIQVQFFEKLKIKEGQDQARLKKFEQRLINTHMRNTVFLELLTRLSQPSYRAALMAIEEAQAEANFKYNSEHSSSIMSLMINITENEAEYFILKCS